MKKGIDVSAYQGIIDWETLKNNNLIDFSILKLGNIYDNQPNYIDSKFEYNYKKCIALNIPTGVYIYNYCNTLDNLLSGINWALSILKNRHLDLPVFLDMEDSSLISEGKNNITSLCLNFCNFITQHSNYIPGIYANLNWLNNYIDIQQLNNCKIWVSQYNSSCEYKGDYMLWQYTNSGKLDGIISNVDMNYLIDNINPLSNNLIAQWQQTMNLTYNCNLVVDGIFGKHCKSEALKHYLCHKNPLISNNHVLFIQKLLNKLSYTLQEDSMFGPNCKNATMDFQQNYNLTVDGCVGPEVTEKLLSLITSSKPL